METKDHKLNTSRHTGGGKTVLPMMNTMRFSQHNSHCLVLSCLFFLFCCWQCRPVPTEKTFPDAGTFLDPPGKFRAHAGMGMSLDRVDEPGARQQIRHFHERGFGGVFITASRGNAGDLPEAYVQQGKPFMRLGREGIVYLDDDFIRVYRACLDEAEKLGMQVILYDDYHFPTGQVAGQFYQQFPEHMAARLDKVETHFRGEGTIEMEVPEGTYLGTALLELGSRETRDVSDALDQGRIRVRVGSGHWKLMVFYLNHEAVLKIRNPGIMNYLEKEATVNFLKISYDRFYEGFGEYFGTVIPMSFYDEPSLHWLDGKIWSADLNELYRERYGESPMKHYPALWYDIGEGTAAARNALYGLRAEMYAEHFVKPLREWCAQHNILLSGHMDQEEVANPVMINGDLMKVFEYQDVPGADDIFWWGRSNPGYKIVTSAAYNYDKPVTWAETYAAYQAIDRDTAYRVAMDQYAMGINMQTPFPGGLERKLTVDEFNALNDYVGRLSYLLQGGRHVSDIAVLYPIASAQACNVLGEGWEYAYTGGEMPAEFDYQQVGEDLFRKLRIDFTYLHPEVLQERCVIRDALLRLDNEVNWEEYPVLILPGGNTLHAGAAKKILAFYRAGGKVIATSLLPRYSAEFGKDFEVRSAVQELFGTGTEESHAKPAAGSATCLENSNEAGGRAFFVPHPDPQILEEVIHACLPVRDVAFDEPPWEVGTWAEYQRGLKLDSPEWMKMQRPGYRGALTYTHKVKEGRDVYFFANSSDKDLVTMVTLRGKKNISRWDPHNGKISQGNGKIKKISGTTVTAFELVLPAAHSIFIIGD
jgi:hypothetical protein